MPRQRIAHIKRMLGARAITEDGMRFLAQSVDPFHDEDFPPTGYPDVSTDKSIVACIEKTVSIAAPATITTGTWDCHITSLPLMSGYSTSTNGGTAPTLCSHAEGSLTAAHPAVTAWTSANIPGTVPDLGPLMIATAQTGSNTYAAVNNFPGPTSFGCLDPGFAYSVGNSRLVSMGFEVANTTSDLYKQGAVAYYRMPQTIQETSIIALTTGTTGPVVPVRLCRMPPVNLAEAMLLSGTVMREAADGAYVPVTLSESNIPFKTGANKFYGMRYQDSELGAVVDNSNSSYNVLTGAFSVDTRYEEAQVDTCGAYFTGLSLQTTLQVTVRFYVEKIPAPYDTQVVVLTRPAATYDPVALELYKRVLVSLPPGTRLSDNASGDWWRAILKVLSAAAPVIGTVLGPFTGGLSVPIGAGIGGLAKVIDDNAEKKKSSPPLSHPTPSNPAPAATALPRGSRLRTIAERQAASRPVAQ